MPSLRSGAALALPLLLTLAACGNYSTDDVAFVEALPARGSLQARVPASAAAGLVGAGSVTCGALGAAGAWAFARPQGERFNAGVDVVLALVDAVRGVPPTRRDRDARTWGPFDDKNHPGKEIRVVMTRSWDGDRPTYRYAFQARDKAGGDSGTLIEGAFVGGSARTGHGTLAIHFGTIRALGMSDRPTDPTGDISVAYDKTGDPQTLELDLALDPTGGFGLEHFSYAFVGWRDGFGRFDYAFRDTALNRLEVASRFAPGGEGQGSIVAHLAAPPNPTYAYEMCWDWNGCATAVNDPQGISGACTPAGTSCVVNWPAGCPATR